MKLSLSSAAHALSIKTSGRASGNPKLPASQIEQAANNRTDTIFTTSAKPCDHEFVEMQHLFSNL
jgi:hypothetical protein